MRWLFLVPLATGVISGYISQKASDDITYLTAAITVISLFLSLVLAPWQVQLGLLLLVLLLVGQIWQKNNSHQQEAKIPKSDSEKKYLYRGVTYSQDRPQPETMAEDAAGKYRGVALNITAKKTARTPSTKPRKYRGVTIEPDA